jgi:hypothetical protein
MGIGIFGLICGPYLVFKSCSAKNYENRGYEDPKWSRATDFQLGLFVTVLCGALLYGFSRFTPHQLNSLH